MIGDVVWLLDDNDDFHLCLLNMEIHCNLQAAVINLEKPSHINLCKAEVAINLSHLETNAESDFSGIVTSKQRATYLNFFYVKFSKKQQQIPRRTILHSDCDDLEMKIWKTPKLKSKAKSNT